MSFKGDRNSYYVELAIPVEPELTEEAIEKGLNESPNTPRVAYAVNKLCMRDLSDEQIIESITALVGYITTEPILVHVIVKEATALLPTIMEVLEYATESGQLVGCLLVAQMTRFCPRELAMTVKPLQALLPGAFKLLFDGKVTLLQLLASVCLGQLAHEPGLRERIGSKHLAVMLKVAKRPHLGADLQAFAFGGLYNTPCSDLIDRASLNKLYGRFYLGVLQRKVGFKRPFNVVAIEEGVKEGTQARSIHVHLPPDEYHIIASNFPKNDLMQPLRPAMLLNQKATAQGGPAVRR